MSIGMIEDGEAWDRFIDGSPNGMLFHKWDFLKIMERYSGGRLLKYGIYRDEELIAVIPILFKTINGLHIAYSPPQSSMANVPYMGIVVSRAFDQRLHCEKEKDWFFIINEIDDLLKKSSMNYINLGLTPFFDDTRPFYGKDYDVEILYTYQMDLSRPIDMIWQGFDRECKKNIRECEKNGYVLKQANDVQTFYRIMRECMVDRSTFFHRQDPEYLTDLMRAFPTNIKMYFVYKENDVVGLMTNITYKERFIAWMGTASSKGHASANEFLVWELIKKAKEEGYTIYENMGADEKRLNPFKSKFNPSLEPCFSITKKDILYRTAKYGTDIFYRVFKS